RVRSCLDPFPERPIGQICRLTPLSLEVDLESTLAMDRCGTTIQVDMSTSHAPGDTHFLDHRSDERLLDGVNESETAAGSEHPVAALQRVSPEFRLVWRVTLFDPMPDTHH